MDEALGTGEQTLDEHFQKFWNRAAGKLLEKESAKELASRAFYFGFSKKPHIEEFVLTVTQCLGGRVLQSEEDNSFRVLLPFKTVDLSFTGDDDNLLRAFLKSISQMPFETEILKGKKAQKILKRKKKNKIKDDEENEDFDLEDADIE